jgi:adenylate cyclase
MTMILDSFRQRQQPRTADARLRRRLTLPLPPEQWKRVALIARLGNLMGMGLPPALDIDLLRSFVLIAEGRSFTQAAARVGRTQSAISLQIRRLESLLGHRVFARSKGGGVQLTLHGERLLERARDLIFLNDDIVGSLQTAPQERENVAARLALDAPIRPATAAARPSIAVLPFENMSDDLGQQYFADGIVDDLIAGLSRIRWLFVIARNSSFAYRGEGVGAPEIGRALGVRYVLQGAVRKAGARLRVAAQLLEARSGALLWAERYDGALDGVFELQDRIVDHIVGVVAPSVQRSEIERARRKRNEDIGAYDLYLRALPHVANHMPKGTQAALPLLQQALKLQPDYAAAHALSAWCHEWRFTRGGFDAADKNAAFRHARAAIASDADDAATLAIAGFSMAFLNGEHEESLSAINRAMALNASCATTLYLSGLAHAIAGHGATAAALASRALRLSPLDPLAFEAHLAFGNTALQEARYDDAAACFARAALTNSNFSTAYFFRAIALSLAGRAEEARPCARRGLDLEPAFRTRMGFEIGMAPELARQFAEGGRRLGLPA